MAAKAGDLGNTFNNNAMKGVGWYLLKTVVFGGIFFIGGGIVDFTLFHDHNLGKAMISYFRDTLLPVYDNVAKLIGRPDLARNLATLDANGKPCSVGIDPITDLPIPCAA